MADIGAERWKLLSPYLDEALPLEGAERAAWLRDLASRDQALAAELEELLARDAAAERGGFLNGRAQPRPAAAGAVVGAYTLDELIGHGGMGEVWLAHRSDGRYQGKVAFKFLDAWRVNSAITERFRREGEILARLVHPNIAALVDAGMSDAGSPYLVLEYVDGAPIDQACDARRLDLDARIRLFLDVLEAVAHAHQHLVVHRDIKPSNVMLSREGRVKLLDFGIGKLLEDAAAGSASTLTRDAGAPLTPEFAAPEQLEGGPVTTATDVFALGGLLYQLLTGRHFSGLEAGTPAEYVRALLQADPPKPSAAASAPRSAASSDGESAAVHLALVRGTTPRQLGRTLAGDLDNILMKALAREPGKRYPSAGAFADDLRRYLGHEPVTARPESFGYRLGKALRRHRVGFAAAGAVAVAVLAGVAGVSWQAVEARKQRDRAMGALARSEAVTEFMNLMITEAAAGEAPLTIPQLVERSEALAESSLRQSPESQATALKVLADFHGSFGDHAKAVPLLERAIAILPPDAESSLRANLVCERAFSISRLGRLDEARRAVAAELSRHAGDRPAELECLLVEPFLSPSPDERRGLARRMEALVEKERRDPTAQASKRADLYSSLAFLEYQEGDNDAADRNYQAASSMLREVGREMGPFGVTVRNNWGMALMAAGDSRRALAMYEEMLSPTSRARGSDVPPNFLAINRARALEAVGRSADALAEYRRMRGWYDLAGDPPFAAALLVGTAGALLEVGDVDGAERTLAEADASGGIRPGSPAAAGRLLVQARVEWARGRLDEASKGAEAAVRAVEASSAPRDVRFRAVLVRAALSLAANRLADARRDSEEALAIARLLQGTRRHSSLTGRAEALLARVHLAEGRAAEARAEFGDAAEQLADTVDPDHPDLRRAREGKAGP